tara:strand:- start:216 stop:401 length:186 start_codon:yes stop_codon:yes gene_type:complete
MTNDPIRNQVDKDQLTPEEYEHVIRVLTLFMCARIGRRVDVNKPLRTIRSKLKKQLESLAS